VKKRLDGESLFYASTMNFSNAIVAAGKRRCIVEN